MTVTINSFWWALPLVITLICFLSAWRAQDRRPASDYGYIGKEIGNAALYGVAIIISLLAWLVYFIVV